MKANKVNKGYLIAVVALLMLVSISNVADKELLAPMADAVKIDLSMNDTQLGLVRSSVFIAALLGQLFWGPLSDRWVRKYVIGIGAITWSFITWITAIVTSFHGLLAARASMSFAEGSFNPSSYALITDTAPKKHHGLILGLMSITYPVGTAVALIIASIVGTENWRKPYIYFGILGIILGLLVFLIVKEPKRGASEEMIQEKGGEYSGRFSFAEFRKALSLPSLWLAFALDTSQSSINWSFAFWAPTYLTRYHVAPNSEVAAIALLPAILGFVFGAIIGGVLIDKLRKRTIMAPVWVSVIAMVGGLFFALIVFNVFNLVLVMTAAFFLGLFTYMVMPAVNIIMFGVVPPETKATTISTSNVILNLVIAILSIMIGVISDATELRFSFGGVVVLMYIFGIGVTIALFSTFSRDLQRREAFVSSRIK
jgi:MFS family permease